MYVHNWYNIYFYFFLKDIKYNLFLIQLYNLLRCFCYPIAWFQQFCKLYLCLMETFKCLKTLITSTYQTNSSMLLWTAFVRKLGATLHNTRLAMVSSALTKSTGLLSLAPSLPLYLNAGFFVYEPYLSTYHDLLDTLQVTNPTTFAEQLYIISHSYFGH